MKNRLFGLLFILAVLVLSLFMVKDFTERRNIAKLEAAIGGKLPDGIEVEKFYSEDFSELGSYRFWCKLRCTSSGVDNLVQRMALKRFSLKLISNMGPPEEIRDWWFKASKDDSSQIFRAINNPKWDRVYLRYDGAGAWMIIEGPVEGTNK